MIRSVASKWKPYREYGHSGVEWLGETPRHWEVKRIKRLGVIRYGLGEPPEYVDDGFPFIRATDIKRGKVDLDDVKKVRPDDVPWSRRPLLNLQEILVVRSGAYTGDSAIVTESVAGCIAGYDMVLTVQKGHAPFVAWVLLSKYMLHGQIYLERLRAAQPHLNAEELGSFIVLVPPLSEQHAIAAFLDRETSRIDALIEKKQRQIELLQEKRAALICHAVTKGLNPNVKMKDSGTEWLGEVPEHWDVPPLYARYSVELGKMLDAKRITGDYLLPYLRNIDVQWDRVNVDNLPEMDVAPEEYARFTLTEGDLLVCEGGEVGRTAIWRGELPVCAFQKAIHRIRPLSGRDLPRCFYYVMRAAASSGVFLAYGNPNTIPHLTAEKLRVYRFGFPPLGEQWEIVEHLDYETARIDALASKVDESIEKLSEYRTALISAAVTGKIDVRQEVTQ
jgi:type I restriction enzyme S subunit